MSDIVRSLAFGVGAVCFTLGAEGLLQRSLKEDSVRDAYLERVIENNSAERFRLSDQSRWIEGLSYKGAIATEKEIDNYMNSEGIGNLGYFGFIGVGSAAMFASVVGSRRRSSESA